MRQSFRSIGVRASCSDEGDVGVEPPRVWLVSSHGRAPIWSELDGKLDGTSTPARASKRQLAKSTLIST